MRNIDNAIRLHGAEKRNRNRVDSLGPIALVYEMNGLDGKRTRDLWRIVCAVTHIKIRRQRPFKTKRGSHGQVCKPPVGKISCHRRGLRIGGCNRQRLASSPQERCCASPIVKKIRVESHRPCHRVDVYNIWRAAEPWEPPKPRIPHASRIVSPKIAAIRDPLLAVCIAKRAHHRRSAHSRYIIDGRDRHIAGPSPRERHTRPRW